MFDKYTIYMLPFYMYELLMNMILKYCLKYLNYILFSLELGTFWRHNEKYHMKIWDVCIQGLLSAYFADKSYIMILCLFSVP